MLTIMEHEQSIFERTRSIEILEDLNNKYSKDIIEEMHSCNKKIYAISPELHKIEGHPRSRSGYEKTWTSLIDWGIDGICTDYPAELLTLLHSKTSIRN